MKEFVLDGDSLARDRHMNLNGDLSDHINIYCKLASHFPVFYSVAPINSNRRLQIDLEAVWA